jgi:DNA-directed RNA polymerase subunit H (RpoH/RPB5)
MDFENIYKSRSVILEMLQARNCDISSYQGQTRDELNILYQQHGSKGNSEVDTLDIIVSRKGLEAPESTPSTDAPAPESEASLSNDSVGGGLDIELRDYKVMVKYLTNNKVRNQNIITCIDEIYEKEIIGNEDVLVIITRDKVTYQGVLEEHINRLYYRDGKYVQILWLNHLQFNITKHDLVPSYRIMLDKEKQELIKKLYIEDDKELPFILITDPVARYYGVRVGQVCEIIYNNDTNGKNKFYRLCVTN